MELEFGKRLFQEGIEAVGYPRGVHWGTVAGGRWSAPMKILARVTQKRSSLFIGYVFLGLHTEDLVELVTSVSDFEQIPELAGCIVGSRLQSPVEVVEFSRRQSRVSGCLFFAPDVIYIAQTFFSLWSILKAYR